MSPFEATPAPAPTDERFRDFLESTPQGWVWQRSDGRVTAANAAAERILRALGLDPEEPDWDTFSAGLVRSDGTPFPRELCPPLVARRTGREAPAEVVGVRGAEGGVRCWMRISALPVRRAGEPEPHEVCCILEDVTGQARRQEQLYLSSKLDSVGRLAGGMAHDFNNLLSVIQGNTDLLLMDALPGDPLHTDLTEIRRACERAASLTHQLLAFSRRQVLHPATVDLGGRLSELVPALQRRLGEDVLLVTDFAADAGLVRADPAKLEEVVLRLVDNARDAMPQGGRLTLSARALEISPGEARAYPYAVVPGAYGEIVVEDTGCGIAEADLPSIFEPFFTTKKAIRAAGLGLATVYGIVKQSGGYVWVETRPEQGSRFRVCLPRVSGSGEASDEGEGDATAAGAVETVLVVEDEAAVRAVARRILERGGYRVLEASDGASALEACRAHAGPIHLILSDVVMPGLSGRELIDALQPLRPEARVLYMSGYSDEHLTSYGLTGEALNLIGKPFRPAALLHKVRSVLRQR